MSTNWRRGTLVFVAVETTGLPSGGEQPALLEVTLLQATAGVFQDEFLFRVNPGAPIPAEATDIHGIDATALMGCPSPAEASDDIRQAVHAADTVVAFHFGFVHGVMSRTFPWWESFIHFRSAISLQHAVALASPEPAPRYSLCGACESTGAKYDYDVPHRGLRNVYACASLLSRIHGWLPEHAVDLPSFLGA